MRALRPEYRFYSFMICPLANDMSRKFVPFCPGWNTSQTGELHDEWLVTSKIFNKIRRGEEIERSG